MNEELERLMREAQTDEPWTVVWYGDEHLPAIAIHRSAEDRVCFMPTIQHPADGVQAEANAALIVAAVNALPGLLAEVEVLRRLAPEYFQWPGKSGADTAPEWLQDRLKYGGASVDGDVLAVYDWHDRRSLAAPGDYVVDGEKGLWVLPADATAPPPCFSNPEPTP